MPGLMFVPICFDVRYISIMSAILTKLLDFRVRK